MLASREGKEGVVWRKVDGDGGVLHAGRWGRVLLDGV